MNTFSNKTVSVRSEKPATSYPVRLERETEKAYQLALIEEGETLWIPKSCIPSISQGDSEGTYVATIHDWFMQKAGIL